MTMHQLSVHGTELDAPPWEAESAGPVIDVLSGNPWRSFVELQGDVDEPWRTYDRTAAIETFVRNHSLLVRSGADFAVDASMSSFQRVNHVRFSILSAVFEPRIDADVEAFIARLLATMPEPSCGAITADLDQMMFKRERGLRRLPELIRQIGWLQVLCPRTYPLFYDRDVLLAAPCHRAEERADGTIWIWAYPHPLEFETPEARDATAVLHQYLYTHAKRSRVT